MMAHASPVNLEIVFLAMASHERECVRIHDARALACRIGRINLSLRDEDPIFTVAHALRQ